MPIHCSIRLQALSMGCCALKTNSPMRPPMNSRKEDVLLRVPGASVHLLEDSEPVGLAKGDFTIIRITEGGVVLATKAKVGLDLQWPLTKDEPVVKLDRLHYLFSLPDKDSGFLNYGLSFSGPDARLAQLDEFLKEFVCFSYNYQQSSRKTAPSYDVYWKDYAPRIEDYNSVLAKAIAQGTGEIVKGIFKCSDAYTNQVQTGADLIRHNEKYKAETKPRTNKNPGEINKTIRRVRKISETTEKMSRALLEGVLTVSGAMSVSLIQSKAGQAFFGKGPGEVMLASLDAMNKVLDAVEVAQRKALAATSTAVTGEVTKRFGESAGEVTEDVFATAGHAVGTAWNLLKIRKAVKPSSLPSNMLKNAVKRG
ncbi:putative senescence/spartin-associated [Dioscorea sansibarensis]